MMSRLHSDVWFRLQHDATILTTFSVAMSPRYLGGKYHTRLHPRSWKCACQFFVGDWACEVELHQTGVICFPWRQRSWSCDVFQSWISDAHCPFQWKWQVIHNYDISVHQQVGMFFNGIACLMKIGLYSSGSSLTSRWRDVTLVREFQMWCRRCKQIDLRWFQGRLMRFWWMWSTISWKYFIIYPVRLFSTSSYC